MQRDFKKAVESRYMIIADDYTNFLDTVGKVLKKHKVNTPAGSYYACSEVTHSLVAIAKKLGFSAHAVGCMLTYPKNAAYADEELRGKEAGHTFLSLGGGFYVDFTIRQFKPKEKYPVIVPIGRSQADDIFGTVMKRPSSEKIGECASWVRSAMKEIEEILL